MSEQLADLVRSAVLKRIQRGQGRYAQGERLTEKFILEDLQATEPAVFEKLSAGPVREALIVLETEEIVEVVPRVGALIRPITEKDMLQLLHNRSALEEYIVSQLAAMKEDQVDLTPSEKANHDLKELAVQVAADASKTVPDSVKEQVIRFDTEFHCGLAQSADYPHLADTLQRLRDRMGIFSWNRMAMTGEHIRQFHDEHQAILSALHERDGVRPNVTEARNAIRRHLKHSAFRWALRPDGLSRDKRDWDMIFDLPDFPPPKRTLADEGRRFDLLAARVAIELVALRRLANDPLIRLDAAEKLHQETVTIYERFLATSPDLKHERSKLITRFLNSDLGLHVALMFLTGLQFAEEAVVHYWQGFYPLARDAVTNDRPWVFRSEHMEEVIEEHRNLLDAIRPATNRPGDPAEAARCYLTHILSSVFHTFHNQEERAQLCASLIQLGAALEPSWKKTASGWLKRKLDSESKQLSPVDPTVSDPTRLPKL